MGLPNLSFCNIDEISIWGNLWAHSRKSEAQRDGGDDGGDDENKIDRGIGMPIKSIFTIYI